jgi:type I restriction enzyme, S subunit
MGGESRDGWVETSIGQLSDDGVLHTQTGPFGSQLHKHDYVSSGVPVIPTEAIGRRLLRPIAVPQIAPETAERLSRHRLLAGDILFARRGVQATGLSAIAYEAHTGWICGTGAILLRVLDGRIDAEFLSFALSSELSFQWLRQHAVGAVMPNLNESVIRDLPLIIPPLPEQKAIAGILGALDDKIELNRRMNETLESMARALFQSWFVDFDPVRTKAEGRKPEGMDDATAALFPDSFQDSELGQIPKGWEVGEIGKIVECVGGTTPSTKQTAFWDNGIHYWATPKDLSGLSSPVLTKTGRKITESGLNKISSGLLPPGTVLMSSRAPVGYLALATIPIAINQGFIAIKCNDNLSNYYVLNWCEFYMHDIEARASGTTFAEISKKSFRPILLLIPKIEVMRSFTNQLSPIYSRLISNVNQSRTLASIRDTLLPKLLSGELRVSEAEKELEEAV